jgi:DNA repair protein RecN (Recombination protein N)
MLLELRIRDLAVIRDLTVHLGPGFNVLTGETGAGKSILVGGLSLLLGERASSEAVRVGADRARVEAVFDLSARPDLRVRLEEEGFPDEDGLLLLRREVQREGRNRAWINGSPASASVVGAFGRALVDLHGQHDHQTLLHLEEQRSLLDAFSGAQGEAEAVQQLHERLQAAERDREARDARARELEARADFLRFQLEEIEAVQPEAGEEGPLEEELRRADHAEELLRESSALNEALYAGDGALAEGLAQARDRLRRLARHDGALGEWADQLELAYLQTTEVGRALGHYASGVEVDPARAEAIRRRLDALHRLKRKYGPELQQVLETAESVSQQLAELDGADRDRRALDEEIRGLEEALSLASTALSKRRREGAEKLAQAVQTLLPDLGLPGARFLVALESLESPGRHGGERVRFLASLNPGFEPGELRRIASGGELARVMLALKAILAEEDQVPTLIFDEVDAGIGGAVALAVGRKLAEVGRHHQVFAITHLPQVAAQGLRHFRVEKGMEEGVATTEILELGSEARVGEIARMLGGDSASPTSRAHATELLSAAE